MKNSSLVSSFFAALLIVSPAYGQQANAGDPFIAPSDTNVSIQRATQTDHLDTETLNAEQDFKFDHGAGSIGPVFQYSRFDQKSVGDANLFRPGLGGSYKINDWSALTGVASVDQIEASGASEHTIATYNAFATLSPSKTLSFDLGSSRNTFANLTSLQQGIAATYFGGDVNYVPDDTIRFTARGNEGLYTDGNERQFVQAETETRLLAQNPAAVFIGARVTAIHYERTLDNGYFDPARYGSAEGLLRFKSELTQTLTLEAGGSAGVEADNPNYRPKITYNPTAKLSYAVAKNLVLDGTAEYYASKLASDSGFSSLIVGLGLHYSWQ